MPFYFRKSVSAGPFRFNFSKGGVGASVGVKGFRIGTGPRGHYVHAGRGGIYYRASLNPKADSRRGGGSTSRSSQPHVPPMQPGPVYGEAGVTMQRVSSGDVLDMQDERFTDLLDELNRKQKAWSSAWLFGFMGFVLGMILTTVGGDVMWVVGLLAGVGLGKWRDTYSRSAVLFYELEDEAHWAYEQLTVAFDQLLACQGKWHVDAGGAVQDVHAWKRNAGASPLIDRRPTTFAYALPTVLKANITPPAMRVGKETLLFLPDVVLVVEKDKVGAVAYDALNVRYDQSGFIETGTLPKDAQVIGYRWKHPNKNGGPDRRFRDNYQIPVCLYEALYLTSTNGLNELVQVSRTGVAQPFIDAIRGLVASTGDKGSGLALPKL